MKDTPQLESSHVDDDDKEYQDDLNSSLDELSNNSIVTLHTNINYNSSEDDDEYPSNKKRKDKKEKQSLVRNDGYGDDNNDGVELNEISLDDNATIMITTPNSLEEEDESRGLVGDTSGNATPINSDIEEINIKDVEKNEPNALNKSVEIPKIPREQWIRVLVVFAAVLSDGLSLTLVQPFLPQMLEERWGYSQSQIGWISGILVGIYSLARFFSSFGIGHLSDKYGRKPFLVLSLASTSIGTIIFAFMPNVYLAMLVRFTEGIFSNTTALCQATLADMIDKRNRPTIFAYLGAIFALSRCLSSTLSGVVMKIVENTPNPYIYPCIVGGGIVMISAILMFCLHPETHPKFAKAGISATEIPKSQKDFSLLEGLKILSKDKKILMLLLSGSVNSFCNGGLLLSFTLFASLSIEHKGLGMDPTENGIMFSILGIVGFIFQISFFKRLSRSIGLKKQYLLGTMLLCVGMMIFPLSYTGYLIQGKAMVWVFLCIVVPITSIGFMQCLPIIGGMVANASKPELQGLTQGTSQSLNSLLRSFGPALSGVIFSLSISYNIPFLLFAVLSFLYLILGIISLYLPDSVDINIKSTSTK